MKFSQNELGFFFKNENCLVFFGNVNATVEKIENFYNDLRFRRIKQTHSDIVIAASEQLNEADAHYSYEKGHALLIATADCTPLMIYCRQTHRAVAIHAGWRGVENQITLKALQKMIATGSTEKDFEFYFGPHIMKDSFEVSEDVFLQLEKSQFGLDKKDYVSEKNDKFYVDLQKIIFSQIRQVIGKEPNAMTINLDTKTNELFHSYRRGKMTSDRNLSFITVL